MRITLVHPGRAYLPEVEAYRRHFGGRYEFRVSGRSGVTGLDLEGDVLWLVMGFFPRRPRAAAVIHDYRSLSVGCLPAVKDRLKKVLTPRPDLRIFQNEAVEAVMGFRGSVPRTILRMGVHAHLVTEERLTRDPEFDFCSVGDVSRARGADLWLRSFLSAQPGRTLALAGHAEKSLRTGFGDTPGITFLGPVSLEESYDLISRSRTGISFIPDRRPYRIQATTKLLEYAAFGRRIVANDAAGNRDTAARNGIRAHFTKGFVFPRPEELEAAPDNEGFDVARISWETRIAESRLDEHLDRILTAC